MKFHTYETDHQMIRLSGGGGRPDAEKMKREGLQLNFTLPIQPGRMRRRVTDLVAGRA